MTSLTEIRERVARGAAWLDELAVADSRTAGWRDRIREHREEFQLASGTSCAIGLSLGEFGEVTNGDLGDQYQLESYEARALGFLATEGADGWEYDLLQLAWDELLGLHVMSWQMEALYDGDLFAWLNAHEVAMSAEDREALAQLLVELGMEEA